VTITRERVDAVPGWHETSGPLPVLRARAGRAFDAGIPTWARQPYRARDAAGAWTYVATPASIDSAAIVDLAYLVDHGFGVAIAPDPAAPDPAEGHLEHALLIGIMETQPTPLELGLADVDEAPPEGPPDREHVHCRAYSAHVTQHRQERDGSWRCEACQAGTPSSDGTPTPGPTAEARP
jgi:hypothetical protein